VNSQKLLIVEDLELWIKGMEGDIERLKNSKKTFKAQHPEFKELRLTVDKT